MVGIMDGESLRTQGARFGRAGSFFAENVRKPEKISFGRLVINKINNQGGLNYHIKASVKLIEFVRENQIIPWQGVYFFNTRILGDRQEIMIVMAIPDN